MTPRRLPPWTWALALLICVLLFNLLLTPGFFHVEVRDGRLFGSLVDILNRCAPVLLLALGMTLVIATGGVDLSVGAVMAISGAVAASLIARPDKNVLSFLNVKGSTAAVVLVSLMFALLCGLFNGLLVSVLELQPIVATLLLMVAGRGVAQLVTDGQIITFQDPSFAAIARGALLGFPMPVWIFLAAYLLVGILTRRTAFGLFVEATGSNSVAARYAGVDARTVKWAVYAISGLCAGIAGLIATGDIQAADSNNAGLYLELDAILAVCVGGNAITGGRFTIVGTAVGALLMQTLTTTILTRGVAPELTLILKAAVVVIVCLMQAPAVQRLVRRVLRRSEA